MNLAHLASAGSLNGLQIFTDRTGHSSPDDPFNIHQYRGFSRIATEFTTVYRLEECFVTPLEPLRDPTDTLKSSPEPIDDGANRPEFYSTTHPPPRRCG